MLSTKGFKEYGIVVSVADGVVTVSGLQNVQIGEGVKIEECGISGIVLNAEYDYIRVILFGSDAKVLPGHTVTRSGGLIRVLASRLLYGRVVDSLGNIIDGEDSSLISNIENLQKDMHLQLEGSEAELENWIESNFSDENISDSELLTELNYVNDLNESDSEEEDNYAEELIYYQGQYQEVEAGAPSIMDRLKISEPLYTGTLIIDSMIPIGRGQRELIIGDRQIGKTTIALDAILNQSFLLKKYGYFGDAEVSCIYVSIGQRRSALVQIFNTLILNDAIDKTIIVAGTASEAASLQFLAPYTGTAYGEFFRNNGLHALIVYDDLSKHAVAYRQMSLLLKRPPGREAYPGDIFYIHSRLLERSAATRIGGTLTAFPVIETLAGDVSGFIPTNVISITDGQIFLETSLFYKGFRPAINLGLSVSRIGSAAQDLALKKVSSSLKLFLSQYKEIEIFSSFSSDLDDTTLKTLKRGMALNYLLNQPENNPIHPLVQATLIYSGINGFIDSLTQDRIEVFKSSVINEFLSGNFPIDIFDELAFGNLDKNITTNGFIQNLLKKI